MGGGYYEEEERRSSNRKDKKDRNVRFYKGDRNNGREYYEDADEDSSEMRPYSSEEKKRNQGNK